MNSSLIRLAQPGDIPAIIALEQNAPSAAHWQRREYECIFQPAAARRLLLVAQENSSASGNTLTGFLVARDLTGEWELENIVVEGARRRHGLGAQLLEGFLNYVRNEGSELVFLEVRESNHPARHLYASRGFVEIGRRKKYYSNPIEDAVLYQRSLTPISTPG